jgi:hypothetical protein
LIAMSGYGPQASISTIHIVGFPANTNEREMENICRWFPGFVGVKATFQNEVPKAWIRFDSPANAEHACDVLNDQPLDLIDTHMKMRVSIAKTELNVVSGSLRKGPVTTAVGPLDSIMAKGEQAASMTSAQLQFSAIYGAPQGGQLLGQQMYPGVIPCWDGQPLTGVGGVTGGLPLSDAHGTTKRRRFSESSSVQDTLVIMALTEKGLDERKCSELFGRYATVTRVTVMRISLSTSAPGPSRRCEGFITSNFNASGKGGGNYFAKYATPEYAAAALKLIGEQGFRCEVRMIAITTIAIMAIPTMVWIAPNFCLPLLPSSIKMRYGLCYDCGTTCCVQSTG